MSNNLKQTELDLAEEYIINYLFGSVQQPRVNDLLKSYLALSGKNLITILNENIAKFETIVTPLLKDNGYVDGEKFSKLIATKLNQNINIADFRLIDAARSLESLLINIRNFIQ